MAAGEQRRRSAVGELFRGPVAGGGEGGKQEAAKDDLLAQRGEGDGEGPKGPNRCWSGKQLAHGGFGGEMQQLLEGEGDEEAGYA